MPASRELREVVEEIDKAVRFGATAAAVGVVVVQHWSALRAALTSAGERGESNSSAALTGSAARAEGTEARHG